MAERRRWSERDEVRVKREPGAEDESESEDEDEEVSYEEEQQRARRRIEERPARPALRQGLPDTYVDPRESEHQDGLERWPAIFTALVGVRQLNGSRRADLNGLVARLFADDKMWVRASTKDIQWSASRRLSVAPQVQELGRALVVYWVRYGTGVNVQFLRRLWAWVVIAMYFKTGIKSRPLRDTKSPRLAVRAGSNLDTPAHQTEPAAARSLVTSENFVHDYDTRMRQFSPKFTVEQTVFSHYPLLVSEERFVQEIPDPLISWSTVYADDDRPVRLRNLLSYLPPARAVYETNERYKLLKRQEILRKEMPASLNVKEIFEEVFIGLKLENTLSYDEMTFLCATLPIFSDWYEAANTGLENPFATSSLGPRSWWSFLFQSRSRSLDAFRAHLYSEVAMAVPATSPHGRDDDRGNFISDPEPDLIWKPGQPDPDLALKI